MMNFAMRMMIHQKEMREFSLVLQAIQPIMTDAESTREEKREALNMAVNELSEDTFKLKPVAEQIMTIINMKEEVCREYLDSNAQTNGILEWLPRMKLHHIILLDEVKKTRQRFGLDV